MTTTNERRAGANDALPPIKPAALTQKEPTMLPPRHAHHDPPTCSAPHLTLVLPTSSYSLKTPPGLPPPPGLRRLVGLHRPAPLTAPPLACAQPSALVPAALLSVPLLHAFSVPKPDFLPAGGPHNEPVPA